MEKSKKDLEKIEFRNGPKTLEAICQKYRLDQDEVRRRSQHQERKKAKNPRTVVGTSTAAIIVRLKSQ